MTVDESVRSMIVSDCTFTQNLSLFRAMVALKSKKNWLENNIEHNENIKNSINYCTLTCILIEYKSAVVRNPV